MNTINTLIFQINNVNNLEEKIKLNNGTFRNNFLSEQENKDNV